MKNKINSELAVIISAAQTLFERIESLESEVAKLKSTLDERLVDRAYVRKATGWGETSMWKYDRKYKIFEGRKKIPYSKFQKIFETIYGASV